MRFRSRSIRSRWGCALPVLAAVLIAGCGGGSSSGTTKVGGADVRDARTLAATRTATGTSSTPTTTQTAAKDKLFAGIPQHGYELGAPDAPRKVLEFVDLQCPFCKQFSLSTLPVSLDPVRAGKVKLVLRTLTFIGPDSEVAARWAAGAAQQNRLWEFVHQFYLAQQQENSGYVTPAFLAQVSRDAGVDPDAAERFAATPASKVPLAEAQAGAERYNVVSTPSFVAGPSGGPLKLADIDISDRPGFQQLLLGTGP